MAEATEEQFNAKVEEVIGDVGVAIAAVARTTIHTSPEEYFAYVREQWKTLGRSLGELIAMEPPR